MKEVKCIVFDWDGTLMDSAPRIVSSMQRTAHELGMPLPSDESVRNIIGLSLPIVFDRLFPERDKNKDDDLYEMYRFQYVEGDSTPTPLFDGAQQTLDWLLNRGYTLCVATGKARKGLQRVLEESQLSEYFDFTIAADEAESKPHPQMLHTIMQRYRFLPENMVMIGDTSFDLEMAKNAQVASIGVKYGAHPIDLLTPHEPVHLLDDIGGLKHYVEQWR